MKHVHSFHADCLFEYGKLQLARKLEKDGASLRETRLSSLPFFACPLCREEKTVQDFRDALRDSGRITYDLDVFLCEVTDFVRHMAEVKKFSASSLSLHARMAISFRMVVTPEMLRSFYFSVLFCFFLGPIVGIVLLIKGI